MVNIKSYSATAQSYLLLLILVGFVGASQHIMMTSMDGYILSRGVQRNSTHHWVLHPSHPGQQQKVLGCDDGLLPITSSTLAAVKDFFRKSYPPPNSVSLHLFQLPPEGDASQLLPLTTSILTFCPSLSLFLTLSFLCLSLFLS